MTYKHTHKVGIKKFQSNMYQHLEKIDKNTDLIITNSGQAVYSVSAASTEIDTPKLDHPTLSASLDTSKRKQVKKYEDNS